MLRGMCSRTIPAAAVLLMLAALLLASCNSLPERSTCEGVSAPSAAVPERTPEAEPLPDPGDFPPSRFAQ